MELGDQSQNYVLLITDYYFYFLWNSMGENNSVDHDNH